MNTNQPSPRPTIRTDVLVGIVRELRNQGIAIDRLLQKHFGANADLDDLYERVLLSRFVGLLEEAAADRGDSCLGAKLGARARPEDFGLIGLIFLACPNLRTALRQLSTFVSVWQGATRLELNVLGETPEYVYQIMDPTIWPRRQDAELTLSSTCSAIRELLGPHWSPIEVHFEHNSPGNCSPLQRIFHVPILFGQTSNRLILDPEDLTRPAIARGSEMLPYLERHLRDLMRSDAIVHESWSSQVSNIIASRLGRADLRVCDIASELGITSRTLQRRLEREGTSLRDLVRQNRSRAVDRLLDNQHAKITNIAQDVGYSAGPTFSRAFKHWRGQSPRGRR